MCQEKLENIMLPGTSFMNTSLVVWGGFSMQGHTDLHRLGNNTLPAIRYRDEILGLTVKINEFGNNLEQLIGYLFSSKTLAVSLLDIM